MNILLFEVCFVGGWGVSIALVVLSGIIAYQEKDKFEALL